MEEWEHSNVSQSYTKRVLKVHHCILQLYVYFESMRMFFKSIGIQFEGMQIHFWNACGMYIIIIIYHPLM